MSEPEALWEQALMEQKQQELDEKHRVEAEIARLWGKYKHEIPWEDADGPDP